MQRKYYIYKLISPSGKVYIGQTYSIHERFTYYKNLKKPTSQRWLSSAILKYGFDSFIKEVLFFNLSKENANKKEIELIKFFKDVNISMNISSGGEGNDSLSKIVYKVNNLGEILNVYKSATEAGYQNNITQGQICSAIERKTYYTKQNFYIYKDLYDNGDFEKRLTQGYNLRSPVIQLTKEGEFIKKYESLKEAAKSLGVSKESIRNATTKDLNRSCKGYLWILEKDYNDKMKYAYNKKLHHKCKSVKAINKQEEEMLYFKSILEASKALNVERTSILYQLKHKTKGNKSTKYYFEYYNK